MAVAEDRELIEAEEDAEELGKKAEAEIPIGGTDQDG